MARGNQRDKAREKNLKKKETEAKGQKKDGNAFKREQESNAEVCTVCCQVIGHDPDAPDNATKTG
ncbi:protein of unknown function [Taphrina deformans PYCC 5710]|uniref:Small EDRK-rich factor-like N-terminal domain-containing protein n=1 Tax=Taphrina deformans (strain PYCC 5710 / ATCC 11124 / CBS 356.35 / IMI 108563 / JCM 9778 / NBRC 8474) TaxID=1097556 RepID=R4XFR5_TAPDE|nr:protein of unknown function [Taphrina deformans PYCC 5710]|eukprot:CCG84513.1 protein of unknown function [Taphrina deformans PYCC 5710]